MNRYRLLTRLDRWLGVPLCALASALRRIGPKPEPPATPPRRILFVGLAEMGAAVLADAALRQATLRHGAQVFFLTFAANRDGLALTGRVPAERCFGLRVDRFDHALVDLWRFRRWVRHAGIDAVVDLEPCSRASALLAWWSAAPRRSGFAWSAGSGPYRGSLYTHPVGYDESLHIRDNFLGLLRALSPADGAASVRALRVVTEDPSPPRSSAARRPSAPATLGKLVPEVDPARHRLVLLHANLTDPVPQRRWPRARWVALAQRLIDHHPDCWVLVIGGAEEGRAAPELVREIGRGRCATVAGTIPVADLPALFALARVLVSSDSGPVHFAAAAGLPVVALYGPETPHRYGPLGPGSTLYAGIACSPCLTAATGRQTSCRDNRCLQALDVDAVAEAVTAWLAVAGPAAGAVRGSSDGAGPTRPPVERVA